MFIDIAPALLIVVNVVLPISEAIGLATPLGGSTLFLGSAVGKVDLLEMTPYVLRFLGIMLIVELMITFIPVITIFLSSFMALP